LVWRKRDRSVFWIVMRCSVCEVANYIRSWHLTDVDADTQHVRFQE
jgi:hypothetical protein